MADGYRWIEHTAELELELAAATEPGVFGQALAAFAEIAADRSTAPGVERRVGIEGEDRAALLAAWIDELEFLAETENLVPDRVLRFTRTGAGIDAVVACHPGHPRTVVKGVTLHRLAFEATPDGFRATVVLDV